MLTDATVSAFTGPSGVLGILAAVAGAFVGAILVSIPRHPVVPLLVVELLIGIVLGPEVLGWVDPKGLVSLISSLGAAVLFFLAGFHVEPRLIRGDDGRRNALTWVLVALLAFGVTSLGDGFGLADTPYVLGIVLCTTAVGALLPILSDLKLKHDPVGNATLGVGAFGELGPLLMLTVFLSGQSPAIAVLALLGFVAAALLVYGITVHRRPHWITPLLEHGRSTSAQTPVRAVMLLLLLMVFLAEEAGAEIVLGAFVAGQIMRLALPNGDKELEEVIEGFGYGFLIPVFFIVSGAALDVEVLLEQPLLPLLALVLLLVVHVGPALVTFKDTLSVRDRVAVGCFTAATLPLVVATAEVAARAELISEAQSALLIGGALLSMVVAPLLGRTLATQSRAVDLSAFRPGGPGPLSG